MVAVIQLHFFLLFIDKCRNFINKYNKTSVELGGNYGIYYEFHIRYIKCNVRFFKCNIGDIFD